MRCVRSVISLASSSMKIDWFMKQFPYYCLNRSYYILVLFIKKFVIYILFWVNCSENFLGYIHDAWQILTNGKYKSLLHRVALNSEVERMSLPFFFGPSLDVTVKPEIEFVDDHNPPSFRQMTYQAYLESNDHHVIEARANLNQIRLWNFKLIAAYI